MLISEGGTLNHFWSEDGVECLFCHTKRTPVEIEAWEKQGKPDVPCVTAQTIRIEDMEAQIKRLAATTAMLNAAIRVVRCLDGLVDQRYVDLTDIWAEQVKANMASIVAMEDYIRSGVS